MKRSGHVTALALLVPALLVGGALASMGALNWGQVACWLAFLAALTSAFAGAGVLAGRAGAVPVQRGPLHGRLPALHRLQAEHGGAGLRLLLRGRCARGCCHPDGSFYSLPP